MLLAGLLSAQFQAPVAGGSYDLLATEILTSSQASVTFSSLGDYAGTYQHLQIRMTARLTSGFTERTINMRLNGDTGNNYSYHALFAEGSSVASNAGTSQNKIDVGSTPANNAAANSFAAFVIDILDPYETSKYTTIRNLSGNTTTPQIRLSSGLWMNTASLTSFSFQETFSSSSFAAGSRFSLYGLRSA
jgi:hypothetical protein